ncbi:MAG: ABC transporter substrate-binding protein [Bacilli bacterium]
MKKYISLMLLGLILSSCQTINHDQDDPTRTQVTITHSVTIDGVKSKRIETFLTNPKKVATFNYGVLDMFLTIGLSNLGITKLGMPKAGLPPSLNSFKDAKYTNVGTLFDPDYTALDFFNPELIILDGRTSALYETFKSRYPNSDILDASLTTYNVSIQKDVAHNIQKLFTTAVPEVNTILNTIETKINAIKAVTQHHEALFVLSNGESLSAYGDKGRYNSLYTDFGFKPAVAALSETGTHGLTISKEYLTEHDPEIIFLMDRASAIGEVSGLDNFISDPLVKTLSAYQNNQIFILDAEAWYLITGGFNSTLRMIKDVDQFTTLFIDE